MKLINCPSNAGRPLVRSKCGQTRRGEVKSVKMAIRSIATDDDDRCEKSLWECIWPKGGSVGAAAFQLYRSPVVKPHPVLHSSLGQQVARKSPIRCLFSCRSCTFLHCTALWRLVASHFTWHLTRHFLPRAVGDL